MDEIRIIEEMQKLEKHIGIKFNDINWLVKAMEATPLPKRQNAGKNARRDYTNSALSTVGDSILKAILSDYLFANGGKNIRKDDITRQKEKLECNDVLFAVMGFAELKQFTYNEYGFYDDFLEHHERVSDCKHNQYIEAITAAIYYDQGFDITKKWILTYLLPKLEKCAKCFRIKNCVDYAYPLCAKSN
jgi:dsRNA-specific ribonuclease